jgi:hypothetical protein
VKWAVKMSKCLSCISYKNRCDDLMFIEITLRDGARGWTSVKAEGAIAAVPSTVEEGAATFCLPLSTLSLLGHITFTMGYHEFIPPSRPLLNSHDSDTNYSTGRRTPFAS